MVYVVITGYEIDIMGIFSTEEKANEYLKTKLNEDGWVEAWELDKPEEF